MTTRKISISNKKKLRHSNKKILRLKLGLIYEYFIYKIIKTKYYYIIIKGKEKEKIKRKGKEKKTQHWENLKEERRRNISN